MNTSKICAIILFIVCMVPLSSHAGNFDGTKPFLCAVLDVHECIVNNDCKQVTLQSVNCPRFLNVDVKKKMITGMLEDENIRKVAIKSVNHLEGNLILQGMQEGRAWSMVIAEKTGKMTLSVSGKDVGFVFFGECLAPFR
jgi:hypothetical protein